MLDPNLYYNAVATLAKACAEYTVRKLCRWDSACAISMLVYWWSILGVCPNRSTLEIRDNGRFERHPGHVRDRGKKSGSVPDVPGRLATMGVQHEVEFLERNLYHKSPGISPIQFTPGSE